MARCAKCRALIDWIETPNGRRMPVEYDPRWLREGPGDDAAWSCQRGAMVKGRLIAPRELAAARQLDPDCTDQWLRVWVPHFVHCPGYSDVRRRLEQPAR